MNARLDSTGHGLFLMTYTGSDETVVARFKHSEMAQALDALKQVSCACLIDWAFRTI